MRRTLAELHERAREELRTNPTITVYTITSDGLELRRPANRWAGINAGLQGITTAFQKMGESLNNALAAARWLPGDKETTTRV